MPTDGKRGTVSISPTSAGAVALSSPGTFNVTVTGYRAWLAIANVPWLTITSPTTPQEASGPVNYTVATNAAGQPARSGTIFVAGRTFTVNQSAGA